MPYVTIAIPFYNSESFLEYAVLSVINQTYTDWELLLIDDGSTDSSLKIAKRYQSNKIRVISDGMNKGLVFRLNQSVELAQCTYYARMDADDIMHIDRIKTQIEFMTNHPDVDVVGSDIYTIDDKNNIIACATKGHIPYTPIRSFSHPTIMGKTDWFRNNRYDSNYIRCEDSELWLRTYRYSVFRNITTPLLFYREYGVPTFSKYLKSQLSVLKIYLRPKKYKINIISALFNIIYAIVKVMVCIICQCFGLKNVFIRSRRRAKKDFNIDQASKDLQMAIYIK